MKKGRFRKYIFRIRQLMDELRPELLVPVRSSMPITLDETINRSKAVSNALVASQVSKERFSEFSSSLQDALLKAQLIWASRCLKEKKPYQIKRTFYNWITIHLFVKKHT